MPQYIVSFLLFFLPFVIIPFSNISFETPKVIVAEIGIELLLLTVLLKNNGFSLKNYSKIYLLTLGSIALLSLVHLIFLRTETTFFGNAFRLQGVFLLWNLILFLLLSSSVSPKDIKTIFYRISFVLLLLSTLVFGKSEAGRAIATLGEPNALSATAVFLWPFVFFLDKKLLLKIGGVLAAIFIVFLSGSRSGFIAFAIQIVFLFLSRMINLSTARSLIICLLLIGASLFLPFIEGGGVYENRADVWKTAVITGFKNPIIGSGFGNIEYTLKQTSQTVGTNTQYQYVDSAHNIFLDWWVQGGMIGLAILSYLIIQTFYSFIKHVQILHITLLLGVLTALLFNPASVVTLLAFWWLLGQGGNIRLHLSTQYPIEATPPR